MDEKSYIPIYRNWLELMETKDTEEKQLAFLKGIFDAFAGIEPPRPRDMENPRGADYARRDGYLVAIPVAERPADRSEAGRRGGLVRSDRKAAAVRENGRMGGRPRKVVDTVVNTENQSKNQSENQSKKTKALRIEEEKEKEKCVCNSAPARARMDVPSETEVVSVATSIMAIDGGYARWWYAEMQARDWRSVHGERVDHGNWRSVLKSWWNRADASERESARQASAARPVARQWKPADWALCAERCANCDGKSCTAGVNVPPDRRTNSPMPPESCPKYKPR